MQPMRGAEVPRIQPPDPPYLGPARFHGGVQTLNPLKRIVIHGTVSPCVRGGARDIARYFRETVSRPSSAHYVVDPGEAVQVVGDHQVAYHAPPNTDSIGVEHCDPQTGPASRWADDDHRAMLEISAELVARLCLAYDVPRVRVGVVGLLAGRRGITGHGAISLAWRQTSHTDPRTGFPWKWYIGRVNFYADQILAAAEGRTEPVVTPITPQPAKPGKTRVTEARELISQPLALLEEAQRIEHRTGWVRVGAGMIRSGLNRLPVR